MVPILPRSRCALSSAPRADFRRAGEAEGLRALYLCSVQVGEQSRALAYIHYIGLAGSWPTPRPPLLLEQHLKTSDGVTERGSVAELGPKLSPSKRLPGTWSTWSAFCNPFPTVAFAKKLGTRQVGAEGAPEGLTEGEPLQAPVTSFSVYILLKGSTPFFGVPVSVRCVLLSSPLARVAR